VGGDSRLSFGFNPVRCASKCHITTFAPPLALAVTVSDALPLTPLSEAATAVAPAVIPVARPLELVVATDAGVAVQLAVDVISAVE
jgi:hypothetical protein